MAPLLASLFLLFMSAHAQNIVPNPERVLGGTVPDVYLLDEKGNRKKLSAFSGGEPLVLSFIYTRCTSACPLIVKGLKEALSEGSSRVLLIDFDDRDTSADLRDFRNKHAIPPRWDIAVAKGENLKRLTEALDFRFFYDEKTDMFAHPNVLVVLSPSLKVSGYMLGVNYDRDKLATILTKAKTGKVELGWVRGILLKCFRYDPVEKTYVIDWSFIAMILGGLIPISGMAYYLFKWSV